MGVRSVTSWRFARSVASLSGCATRTRPHSKDFLEGIQANRRFSKSLMPFYQLFGGPLLSLASLSSLSTPLGMRSNNLAAHSFPPPSSASQPVSANR